MSNQADLRARFNAIQAHYAPHLRAMAKRPDEWAIDPYAWDSRHTGIHLTPIEWAMWSDIRAEDCVMYPQLPVGRFFVDFGNPAAKVAIECDGEAWHTDKKKDAARDAELRSMGWATYRISGAACLADDEYVDDPDDERTQFTPGIARRFLRVIHGRHPIRRHTAIKESRGPRLLGDILHENVARLLERAA